MFRIVRSSCPRLPGYWLIFNVFHALPRSIKRIYRFADSINFKQTRFSSDFTAILCPSIFPSFAYRNAALGDSGLGISASDIQIWHTFIARPVLFTAYFATLKMKATHDYTLRKRQRKRTAFENNSLKVLLSIR